MVRSYSLVVQMSRDNYFTLASPRATWCGHARISFEMRRGLSAFMHFKHLMQIICRVYAEYMQTMQYICRLYADYVQIMQTMYRVNADYLQIHSCEPRIHYTNLKIYTETLLIVLPG